MCGCVGVCVRVGWRESERKEREERERERAIERERERSGNAFLVNYFSWESEC